MTIQFQYDDGGRAAAGFRGKAADCVTRTVAIATGLPYQQVYDDLNRLCKARTRRSRKPGSARTGVPKDVTRTYLVSLGWVWTPTMQIGQGCRTHLRASELPGGRLIVSVSGHFVAVIDGVMRDTYDPSRYGNRCVYGYWRPRAD